MNILPSWSFSALWAIPDTTVQDVMHQLPRGKVKLADALVAISLQFYQKSSPNNLLQWWVSYTFAYSRACVCVCVCVYVGVCVRVCAIRYRTRSSLDCEFNSAGGSSTTLTGDPTKTVKVRADIWPDQPDVPAQVFETVVQAVVFRCCPAFSDSFISELLLRIFNDVPRTPQGILEHPHVLLFQPFISPECVDLLIHVCSGSTNALSFVMHCWYIGNSFAPIGVYHFKTLASQQLYLAHIFRSSGQNIAKKLLTSRKARSYSCRISSRICFSASSMNSWSRQPRRWEL